ncbi:translation initiation factor IF-2, partial [Candidatus Micrarchaeota archaeon]|nr:translation initiation factor IF-2 [Candidatus Micrarchaeota archaeon]
AGIKIAAPNLENALAGSPLRAIETGNEREEIEKEINNIEIKSDNVGPILKTDALGSLEAIIKLLEKDGIMVRRASVGEITRKDIIEVACLKEKDPIKSVIIAFNTNINPEALEEAKKREVKIFEGKVVYKLIEEYNEWIQEAKQREKEKALAGVTFPARIRIMPNCIFRNSKPAIVGVKIEEGRLMQGVKLMKKGKTIGKVAVIQHEGKTINEAKKGEEVAVSIEGGVVGRNINEKDELTTFVSAAHCKKLEETDVLKKDEKELLEEIRKEKGEKE